MDTLTLDTPHHASVLPGYPAIEDLGALTDVITRLADSRTSRISFYSYSLPETNLQWIERVISATDTSSG